MTVPDTTPEVASVHDQVTTTLVLFQPLPFAGVRLTKVMIGATVSRLTFNVAALVVKPALLVQDPLKFVPVLSVSRD